MDTAAHRKARLDCVCTIAALKRADPGERGLRAIAGLSEDGLTFSAQDPHLSDAGRALAREALAAKVGPDEAERRINAFLDELPPPSWLAPADVAAGDQIFFGLGAWVRRLLGVVAAISVFAWLALAVIVGQKQEIGFNNAIAAGVITQAEHAESQRAPTAEETEKSAPSVTEKEDALIARPQAAPFFEDYHQWNEWGTQAIWWALLASPIWTFALGLRPKPARVLLLRRFNDKSIDASISKFSRRDLQPYGHVYALADRYFRRAWLPMLFSWFSFNPFLLMWRVGNAPFALVRRLTDRSRGGPIMIWSARDFRNFANRLSDRYGLNLEVARTKRRAVAVRTSDLWWQHVVLFLMHAADVIVVDVTEVASGTAWELETMLHEQVSERLVFVARADRRAEAEASLHAHNFGAAVPLLHFYETNGRSSDRRAFRAAVLDAIRRRLAEGTGG